MSFEQPTQPSPEEVLTSSLSEIPQAAEQVENEGNLRDRLRARVEALSERARTSTGKVSRAAAMFAATTALISGISQQSVEAAPTKKNAPPAKTERLKAPGGMYNFFAERASKDEEGRALLQAVKRLATQEDVLKRLYAKQKRPFNAETFASQHAKDMVKGFTHNLFYADESNARAGDEAERAELSNELDERLEKLGGPSPEHAALENELDELDQMAIEQGAIRLERLLAGMIAKEAATYFKFNYRDTDTLLMVLKEDKSGSFRTHLKQKAPEVVGFLKGLRKQYPSAEKRFDGTVIQLFTYVTK